MLNLPRFESVSEADLMSSLKISEIAAIFDPKIGSSIQSPNEHEKFKSFSASLLWFLFQDFLVPLIRYNFYVTESSYMRTKLYFYRHETWKRITSPHFDGLLNSMFTPANPVKNMSKLRLVPKENGKFRPITAFYSNTSSVR